MKRDTAEDRLRKDGLGVGSRVQVRSSRKLVNGTIESIGRVLVGVRIDEDAVIDAGWLVQRYDHDIFVEGEGPPK